MKKWISLLIVIVMTILSGCNSSPSKYSSENVEKTTSSFSNEKANEELNKILFGTSEYSKDGTKYYCSFPTGTFLTPIDGIFNWQLVNNGQISAFLGFKIPGGSVYGYKSKSITFSNEKDSWTYNISSNDKYVGIKKILWGYDLYDYEGLQIEVENVLKGLSILNEPGTSKISFDGERSYILDKIDRANVENCLITYALIKKLGKNVKITAQGGMEVDKKNIAEIIDRFDTASGSGYRTSPGQNFEEVKQTLSDYYKEINKQYYFRAYRMIHPDDRFQFEYYKGFVKRYMNTEFDAGPGNLFLNFIYVHPLQFVPQRSAWFECFIARRNNGGIYNSMMGYEPIKCYVQMKYIGDRWVIGRLDEKTEAEDLGKTSNTIPKSINNKNLTNNSNKATVNGNVSSSAKDTFVQFHKAITRKDLRAAYNTLSPDYQRFIGSYEQFSRGYTTTIRSDVVELKKLSENANSASFAYKLKAVDREGNGQKIQYFAGKAKLIRINNRWRIDSTEAKRL